MTGQLVTTEEILNDAEERLGFTRPQLIILAAKSATVRHLATHPDYKDRFVLKGGTLLAHVYNSTRQSIADADYTYVDPDSLKTPDLEDALTVDGEHGLYIDPEDMQWSYDNELFEGKVPFALDGIQLSRRAHERRLKVTVSVRAGERLDPCDPQLYYDGLLADDRAFHVTCLTRNELSSEKLLGWSSKPLSKHFFDLAYVARDHAEHIDHTLVADLVKEKFSAERKGSRYVGARIYSTSDLAAAFGSAEKLKTLADDWERFTRDDLLTLPRERELPTELMLDKIDNVQRLALDFWRPTLELLS